MQYHKDLSVKFCFYHSISRKNPRYSQFNSIPSFFATKSCRSCGKVSFVVIIKTLCYTDYIFHPYGYFAWCNITWHQYTVTHKPQDWIPKFYDYYLPLCMLYVQYYWHQNLLYIYQRHVASHVQEHYNMLFLFLLCSDIQQPANKVF